MAREEREKHRGEPARGIAFEGIRNWITDGIIHFFLERLKRWRNEQWKQLVFTLKKYETQSRAAVIAASHLIDEVFHRIPILDTPLLSEWRHEMLEQLPESFRIYARGQDIAVPEDFTIDETAIGPLIRDVFGWIRDTAHEWLSDVTGLILAFLPWVERARRDRDEHLIILASLNKEDFDKWSRRVTGVGDDDRAIIMRMLRPLSNPRFMQRVLEQPDDQWMSFLRMYAGKGVEEHIGEAVNGVGRTITPLLVTYSRGRQARNAELDRRKDGLMRRLGLRR